MELQGRTGAGSLPPVAPSVNACAPCDQRSSLIGVTLPDAEALNKDLEAYNQRCGGISYDPADREAIMKEREAAGKK